MAARQRRPWVWLVVAAVLLGAGAWLMRGAEPPERTPPPPVRLPTRMTSNEHLRNDTRRTWTPPPMSDAGAPAEPQRPRDPVLALMPAEVKRGAVVAEFNAIMNSEVGGLMADCVFGGDDESFLSELRDAGLDPTQQIDRVAMIDDSVVVTGDFRNAGWKKFLPGDAVTKDYGRKGQLIEVPLSDGGVETFATWDGQMFIAGDDEAALKGIIDRLDGSGPPVDKPVLDDSMAYGEVYGVLAANALADVIGRQDARLGETIRQTAKNAQLHMDVSHDVGMVADVEANDPEKAEELRRTLGSALSLARLQAQAKGNTEAADLLDLARVRSAEGGAGFRLEAGLPYEFMEQTLKRCVEERRKERAARVSD